MIRNPNWDPATDPNRRALPDRIEVALNVNSDDIDNQLIAGNLDVAIEGGGVGAAAQGRILADPALLANTDSALVARLRYTAMSASVPPLDNIGCRKAVLYSADRNGYQRAYGGASAGRSRRTCCRRSSRARSGSTCTRPRTTQATSTKPAPP